MGLLLDYMLGIAEIHIPDEVRLETTKEYRKYQDARIIKKRIDDGKIIVDQVIWKKTLFKDLEDYNLDLGEKELILLCLERGDFDFIIVDDFLACIVCQRFKISNLLFLDLIIYCVEKNLINPKLAIKIVKAIKSRYHIGFINHTISELERKGV